jgi:putative restriction endonuclease
MNLHACDIKWPVDEYLDDPTAMQFWVGVTDDDWYIRLSRLQPDEVNLWQPSLKPLRNLEPGSLFLFKLRAPNDVIVGGGYFVRFTVLPCFLAWEAFQERNGVATLQDLILRAANNQYHRRTRCSELGCNILLQPFFLPEEDWIPIPENWSTTTHGLTYDSEQAHGQELWNALQLKMRKHGIPAGHVNKAQPTPGAFQVLVTDAYHRCCAVTDEKLLPALAAAPIKPFAKQGPYVTGNGILLRADIYRLFMEGYVTIDPDLRFIVSEQLRELFEDSREYYRYHGARLQNLPDTGHELPAQEFLRWHREECFERI